MAAKETAAAVQEKQKIRIIIPRSEDDSLGSNVDQYEHVTVNGVTTLIKRGEYVEVSPEVFTQLKNKFPFI